MKNEEKGLLKGSSGGQEGRNIAEHGGKQKQEQRIDVLQPVREISNVAM